MSARPPVRPTADALIELIERFETADRPLRGDAYVDGGLDALFPRLVRAAINQLEGGPATLPRYGIWANGLRDHIAAAMQLMVQGDTDAAMPLLVRAHNAMAAFAEVQARLDGAGQPVPSRR